MGGSSSQCISPLPIGKTVMITGGNSGIGYETAKTVAMMGAKVILVVRTEDRGMFAIKKIHEDYEMEKKEGKSGIVYEDRLDVQYMVCDLSSLKAVLQFIDKFKGQVLTEEKNDVAYQVNYLSHFLIISHFLPIMQQSGQDCRIVMCSSHAHNSAKFNANYAGGHQMDPYDAFQCYANTKLFQLMFMYSLDECLRKIPNVDIMAVDPGMLDAVVYKRDPRSAERGFNCRLCCMKCCGQLKSLEQGSARIVYAAFSPELKGVSRGYYNHPADGPVWPSKEARKKKLQEYLWHCTVDQLHDHLTPDVMEILSHLSLNDNEDHT